MIPLKEDLLTINEVRREMSSKFDVAQKKDTLIFNKIQICLLKQ